MLERFKIHVQDHFPEFNGKKLLLAVSGGIDSMVLSQLLLKLDYDFSLAHCNFNLRGTASDLDEALVTSEAQKNQTRLHLKQFDTVPLAKQAKVSIQMAARDLRYAWFNELIDKENYDYLLTAHHADDNIETFLINLSRGTGLDGLTGIPEKIAKIRRPLLPFSKEEISVYAESEGIIWREDQSNRDNKYVRNKIRNELIPILKELNSSFSASFSSTLDHLKGSQQIVKDQLNDVLSAAVTSSDDPSIVRFKTQELQKFANNRSYYFEIFSPYGFDQTEEIKSLLTAQPGKQLLSKTHRLVKDRETLLLSKLVVRDLVQEERLVQSTDQSIDLGDLSIQFNSDKLKDLSGLQFDAKSALFDKNLLTFPLSVRKWEKGDYFYPIGMKGKKKLSKFFKDEKYSLLQKENIWLLCSGSKVIWVIGKRMDDRYKITDNTTHILKATVKT